MICKCGSSDLEASSAVIGFNEATMTVSVSAILTCASCHRLLASGNAVITTSPFYPNVTRPSWAKTVLDTARWKAWWKTR